MIILLLSPWLNFFSMKARSLSRSIYISSEGLCFILISLPSNPAIVVVLSELVPCNYNLDYVVYLVETGMYRHVGRTLVASLEPMTHC